MASLGPGPRGPRGPKWEPEAGNREPEAGTPEYYRGENYWGVCGLFNLNGLYNQCCSEYVH